MAGLTAAFQNCTGQLKAAVTAESLASTTPTGSSTCVRQSKAVASPLEVKIAEELLAKSSLAADEDLVVVFDNECLKTGGAKSFLSARAIDKGLSSQSGLVAYRIQPGSAKTIAELQQSFNDDPCLNTVDIYASYELNLAATLTSQPPNDPRYATQPHLSTIKHNQVFNLSLNAANGVNRDVRIAIIDSGMDVYHPDLSANVLRTPAGDPVVYNATNRTTVVVDAGFHGTHVAGLAAAISDNATGVSGVMGKHAKLMSVKVATDDSVNILNPVLDLDAIVNGIRWAADQGAEVINLSLGGSGSGANRPSMKQAVEYATKKGAFVVMAAGNDGRLLNSTFQTYPAVYAMSLDGAIAVGSIDATTGAHSVFSNYGGGFVDIVAPGSDGSNGILSTVPSTLSVPYASKFNITNADGTVSSGVINGTSMASPVAAGSAALMIGLLKSRGLNPTPRQLKRLFLIGARKLTNMTAYAKDGNVLDLQELVKQLDLATGVDTSSTAARNSVNGNIVLSKQPVSTTRIFGESADFEIDLSPAGKLIANIQWYKNGIPIMGATHEILHLENVTAADHAVYTAKATLGSTVVQSQPAELKLAASYCN